MPASSIHSAGRTPKSVSDAAHRSDGEIRNKILMLLPPNELDALLERSELVEIKSKQILYQPEEKLEYVHFPENCVISLVTVMEDGDQVEAMTVGSDGFSEIPVFHGVETSRNKAVGQISGVAHRQSVKDFRDLVDECPDLRRLLHRYAEFIYDGDDSDDRSGISCSAAARAGCPPARRPDR